MRASTLFALTIAILLGLAVVVGAKYAGVFDPKQPDPPKKEEVYQILVAKTNLFQDTAVTGADVYIRQVRPEERQEYLQNKKRYMPPLVQAAHMRIMNRDVQADTPLLHDYFKDMEIPGSVSERLDPKMRAVPLTLAKERASGGLLRLNEFVDVYLTTNICAPDNCVNPTTQTALIARDLKIIVKRNNLWTTLAPPPENQPVQFTLQANPYRAALIEFARLKGQISLVPSPNPKQKSGITAIVNDPESKEFRDEEQKVAAFLAGENTVGDADLDRIFGLKPLPRPVPPITVERYTGVSAAGVSVFPGNGPKAEGSGTVAQGPGRTPLGYSFRNPEAAVGTGPGSTTAAGRGH